jgi:NAD(P)H dehydrogenase (quinone)
MNRREFLKRAGVLSAAVILALYSSPSDAADPQSVTVLVTYHSASGNTEKMAQVVAEGAKAVSGTSVVLKRVGEVIGDDPLVRRCGHRRFAGVCRQHVGAGQDIL